MGKLENVFQCRGCGRCCTDLIDQSEERILGLVLMPDELGLFERDIIRPCMGFDNNPASGFSPAHIVRYQLAVNVCPHHSAGHRCRIYANRPLVCRAFPFTIQYPASKSPCIDRNCTCFSNTIPGVADKINFAGQNELKAYKKLLNPLVNAFHQFRSISIFNLRSNAWEPGRMINKDLLPG